MPRPRSEATGSPELELEPELAPGLMIQRSGVAGLEQKEDTEQERNRNAPEGSEPQTKVFLDVGPQ